MNTTPDEVKLALWLDDELDGEELAAVEAWARTRPEHLAAREEARRWRNTIRSVVPASEEPPFPDFFNSRIAKAIREAEPRPALPAARTPWWRGWLLPSSAFAGMALAFWLGTLTDGARTGGMPAVYTPQTGVDAEWFASAPADATVIVLQGVDAIPDSLDLGETAALAPWSHEGPATVSRPHDPETPRPVTQ